MESDEGWLGLGILLLCLVLLAFTSSAEAALATVGRAWAASEAAKGEPRAQTLERLLQRASSLASLFLVAKSLALVGASGMIVLLTLGLWGEGLVRALVSLVGSLLFLLFLQAIARGAATRYPERAALMLADGALALAFVFSPLAGLFHRSFLLGRGGRPDRQDEEMAELVGTVAQGMEEGERQMIRGIFGLEETTAREIMVPRIDIVAVDTNTPLPEVVDVVIDRGYSRIPLFEGTIDNIVGVIYAKDLLRWLRDRPQGLDLKAVARPAHFIPDSKRVDELLREMQRERVHMAIVVDEYGGTAGVVTIEDLLEEIVGEIADEYDFEEPQVERVSDTEAVVDARLSIDDLNELLGLQIRGEDFDTVGGFVYSQLGKIPAMGDTIEANGLTLAVLSTAGRRIKKVRVTKRTTDNSRPPQG